MNNVKKWYQSTYPTDEMGEELNSNLTFQEVWESLQQGKEFYSTIGAADSVIRERIFEKIAETMGITYDEVYNTWLNCKEHSLSLSGKMRVSLEYINPEFISSSEVSFS